MNIYDKLLEVQSRLKVSKDNMNTFGGYKYRSCEDILEGVKPLLKDWQATVTLTDEIILIGDRYYIKATASFTDTNEGTSIQTSAFAREDIQKKGMDLAQITGSVSSYARKYALNGLFCIDDTKDSDATNHHGKDDKQDIIQPKPPNNPVPTVGNYTVNVPTKADEKAEQEMEALKTKPISEQKCGIVTKMIKDAKVDTVQFLERYKINLLAEITNEMLPGIIKKLQTTIDAPKGATK